MEVFGKVTLSPMLYILSDPILACKIRDSSDIVGFSLPGAQGRQFKVGQYMDDTTSFVKDTRSLHALFQQICLYEQLGNVAWFMERLPRSAPRTDLGS